jgi:O-antigen/teichoic acid export membrane protein
MVPPRNETSPGPLAALRGLYQPWLAGLLGSDTAKTAGLAAAMIGNNVIALGSSIVFARLINDYGSLAALISYLIILTVAGQALQVATAREGVLGHLGVGEGLIATLRSWNRSLLLFTGAITVISILLRHPIAQLVGVRNDAWAAAVGLPAGCLYLHVSLLRGALQGVGDYKSVGLSLVGEQVARLVLGSALAVVGLGVAGAYLGSLLSYVAMSLYCWLQLRGQLLPDPPAPARSGAIAASALHLWAHVRRAWVPIAGLAVIQLLQNIDLITAKHRFAKDLASSYAVTAVAAKVLIWVAMGAGFYLVPETSRRRAAGEDTRGVLLRALGVIAVCAIPCLLIFAVASHPLLAIVFGSKRATASASLLPLGAAFTVLAATYLAVQYMLALKRMWFLIAIGAVAVVEPVLLLQASRRPAGFAAVVLGVQAAGALLAFGLALRRDNAPPATAVNPEPA